MSSKYRVVSITWVDVYASDESKAHQIAGDIYYNMTPEEHDSLPGLSVVSSFGEDVFVFDGSNEPGWLYFSPSNDPF